MQPYLTEDFLLPTKTARELYHNYAAKEPIIDYHCHIPPADIALDKTFDNIAKVWLSGDHYKWRLMRAAGIEEKLITGDAPDYDKFAAFISVLEKAYGNPLYHWCHLELWRYFGINEAVSAKNAKSIWDKTTDMLKGLSARKIIKSSNVELLCTTDDPADTLKFHTQLSDDKGFDVRVLPAFRPDAALYIESDSFTDYINRLSETANIVIDSYDALCDALCARLGYFAAHGCVTADHGITHIPCSPADKTKIEKIMKKRLSGKMPTELEIHQYRTALLQFLGEQYANRGWVMQLHFGVNRGVNTRMTQSIGANTGYDCMYDNTGLAALTGFLDALDNKGALPKTIVYSLNPNDNAALVTIAGCFNNVKHGAAWWFNDHYDGMYAHMRNLAAIGYLAGFVGMLTDSRSLLSYPRHEYFRRILCAYLGDLAEAGCYPGDMGVLSSIVRGICYGNTKAFFGF